jgi:hypothetical protein
MRSLLLVLVAAALLPASASAATVSGTLSRGHGYTVIALAPSGQSAKSPVGTNGRFSVKIPGRASTLQLVKPNGAYFGPVVLGKAGKKAIVDLSTKGGSLGRVTLKRGFAAAKAPKKAVSSAGAIRTTRAGAPLGAGNLGFVRPGRRRRAEHLRRRRQRQQDARRRRPRHG